MASSRAVVCCLVAGVSMVGCGPDDAELGDVQGLRGVAQRLSQAQPVRLEPAAPDENTWFGFNVEISGNHLATNISGPGTDSHDLHVYHRQGTGWSAPQVLTRPSNGRNEFANELALSGDRLLVSAPSRDYPVNWTGHVYAYEYVQGTWEHTQTLTEMSTSTSGFGFGLNMAIDGDNALIRNGPVSGPYTFDSYAYQNGAWAKTGALPLDGFRYLTGTDMSRNHAIVSDENTDMVTILELQNGVWAKAVDLVPSTTATIERLGKAVAIDNGRAIVSMLSDASKYNEPSRAFIFELVNGAWTQVAELTTRHGAVGDAYGISVDIQGDTAVVGALYGPASGSDRGVVYVYERINGLWTETAIADGSYSLSDASFGYHVTLGKGTIAVGAPFEDHSSYTNVGALYLFGATTTPAQVLATDDEAELDEDGSVDIDVLANDVGQVSLESVGVPAHGTASIQGASIVYTPEADFFGSDSFAYTISDATSSSTATVTVTVLPINDRPQAQDVEVRTVKNTAVELTLRGLGADGDNLNFVATPPAKGELSGIEPNLLYTPALDFVGTVTFTYSVSDGTQSSMPATITIRVDEDGAMPDDPVEPGNNDPGVVDPDNPDQQDDRFFGDIAPSGDDEPSEAASPLSPNATESSCTAAPHRAPSGSSWFVVVVLMMAGVARRRRS